MKRTTVMIEEELLIALDEVARKRRITKSQALREAIAAYTGRRKGKRKKLPLFAGSGSSAHPGSLGKDAEEILKKRSSRKGWE